MRRILTAILLSALALPAFAGEPKNVGSYKSWNAYVQEDGAGVVCFMATNPIKSEDALDGRQPAYAMVSHRPGEQSYNTVQIVAGFEFKPGAPAVATIGAQTYDLFTDGDSAFAKDDEALSAAIRAGATMLVQGTTKSGKVVIDTYSLAGSTAAYRAIGKACGLF